MKTIVKIAIVIVIIALPLVFWGRFSAIFNEAQPQAAQKISSDTDEKTQNKDKKDKKGKKHKKDKKDKDTESVDVSANVKVTNKWELPSVLTEISGLEYLSNNRFACIQDEDGIIFIYDAAQKKIVKEISFAGAGDYEGIAIAGSNAYVLRSDGVIFEVRNYESAKPSTLKYATPLSGRNVEGLCYDKKNNRLLLAIKGSEPSNVDYKGIYAFDLGAKKMVDDAVFKINLDDPIFKGVNEKKQKNVMQPSEIEINPASGEIYIIEGTSPKMLIMDQSGNLKKLYKMSSSEFQQAEGITFTPQGDLYISNEGKKVAPNILKVEVSQ